MTVYRLTIPVAKQHSGCTTRGHEVNLPKAHSVAADETKRRQSTVKYQNYKQDKSAAASNKKFLQSDRRTYEYDYSDPKKGVHIVKEQLPM